MPADCQGVHPPVERPGRKKGRILKRYARGAPAILSPEPGVVATTGWIYPLPGTSADLPGKIVTLHLSALFRIHECRGSGAVAIRFDAAGHEQEAVYARPAL